MKPQLLFFQNPVEFPPLVDLAQFTYWVTLAVAIILVQMARSAGLRKTMLALVNTCFLAVLMPENVLFALGGIVILWGLLKGVENKGWHNTAAFLVGGSTLALFVIHKRPDISTAIHTRSLNPVLAGVAFSYVALRVADLVRHIYEEQSPAPDILSTLNYLLPFHMLAAGPIQRYQDFVQQPAVPPAPSLRDTYDGLDRIAMGLFKKYVLAQTLSHIFLTGFQSRDPWTLFLEVQVYYIWVYLDFSGYSDVAVGTGKLLGLQTPENFNYPLMARNIVDFWTRWHISLSKFIQFHLFFPIQMALMRRNEGANPLRAGVVAWGVSFTLCGLWHGISWLFLFWGFYHGMGLVACKSYEAWLIKRRGRKGLKKYLKNLPIRILMTIITFEFVALSLALIAVPYDWIGALWQ